MHSTKFPDFPKCYTEIAIHPQMSKTHWISVRLERPGIATLTVCSQVGGAPDEILAGAMNGIIGRYGLGAPWE